MERDLPAEIDKMRFKLAVVEGEALFASHLMTRLLVEMVGSGLWSKQHIVDLIDATLLVMERQDASLTASGISTAQARTRLQGLLSQIPGQT